MAIKPIQPLEAIYLYLTSSVLVEVWEKERVNIKHTGIIVGFDEYMNLVLDRSNEGKGRILLKGDCICAIVPLNPIQSE